MTGREEKKHTQKKKTAHNMNAGRQTNGNLSHKTTQAPHDGCEAAPENEGAKTNCNTGLEK